MDAHLAPHNHHPRWPCGEWWEDDLLRCEDDCGGQAGLSQPKPNYHARARHFGAHLHGMRPLGGLSIYRWTKGAIFKRVLSSSPNLVTDKDLVDKEIKDSISVHPPTF